MKEFLLKNVSVLIDAFSSQGKIGALKKYSSSIFWEMCLTQELHVK